MLPKFCPIRFCCGFTLALIIIALGIFNSVLIWVATGPRVLEQATPYIEDALSDPQGDYRVDIGKTVLIWEGWRNPIAIRLRDVKLLDDQGQTLSEFPNMRMGMHIPSLFIGKLYPTSISVNQPVISLLQKPDHSIGLGIDLKPTKEPNSKNVSPLDIITKIFAGHDSRLSYIDSFTLSNASISLGSTSKGKVLTAEHTNLTFRRAPNGELHFDGKLLLRYSKLESPIGVSGTVKEAGGHVSSAIQFQDIIPAKLEMLLSSTRHLAQLTMPISGGVQAIIIPDEQEIKTIKFQITGGEAEINHEQLAAPLPLDRFEARGEVFDNFASLNLTDFSANIGVAELSAAFQTTLKEPIVANGTASIEKATSDDIRRFWPPTLAPESRQWVLDNIKPAKIPSASITFDIAAGDLDKPVLPRKAVQAVVTMNEGTIRYLPEHPQVTNMNATINIDAVSLRADISSARFMKDSTLSDGTVTIDDLNADNPRINVSFSADSSAADAVRVLQLPRLEHAERLNLKESVKGTVKTKAELAFDFYAPTNPDGTPAENDNIVYDVTTQLTGITQQAVLNKFDLTDCGGSLHVKNGSLVMNGAGKVNGATAQKADIRYLFTPDESGLDTFIEVKAEAPTSSLPRFGYPKFEFLSGIIGATASVKLGPETEISKAELDLTTTTISDNPLGWTKGAGTPATLTLEAQKTDGKTNIDAFNLSSSEVNLKGSLGLNDTLTDITSIKLSPSYLGDNKLQRLQYQKTPSQIQVDIVADRIDLISYIQNDESEDEGFSFEAFPKLLLKADIKELLLEENAPIANFKGMLDCRQQQCGSANIKGETDGAPFHFQILNNPNGQRQLALHADNAAKLLRSFGVFDGMQDGVLSISGNYTPVGLEGRLVIIDYTLNDAPVLGKILSLASLTGFFDTLQGKGIAFKKMNVPFTLQNDVITLKDAKTYGPAMGLTADGTIAMPHVVLNIDGTLVPSYTLNSSLDKVPVVGDILTGDSEGIFAARFSVKDSYKDPEVTVNPLSMLTPGFLRNVFEIFDGPEKKPPNNEGPN